MRFLACLLLLFGCTVAYAAPGSSISAGSGNPGETDSQERARNSETDFLIFSGEFAYISSTNTGGAGSLDWVHRTDRGTTFTVGIASHWIADSRWTVGRAGVAFRPRERVILNAGFSLGPGNTKESRFTYASLRGGLTYKTSKHLYLKLQDEYLNVGQTQGNLLKTGALLLPAHVVSLDLDYARSLGGNLNTEFVSGRADFNARHWRFLMGASVGHSTPGLLNIAVGSQAPSGNLKQAFFGVGIPVSRTEMTAVVDFLNLGAVRKRTLTVSFKFPLHRR